MCIGHENKKTPGSEGGRDLEERDVTKRKNNVMHVTDQKVLFGEAKGSMRRRNESKEGQLIGQQSIFILTYMHENGIMQ